METIIKKIGFEELLEEKRHRELVTLLTNINKALKTTPDDGIRAELTKQTALIEQLINIPPPTIEIPTNNNEQLLQTILEKLQQKKQFEFTVHRDQQGFIKNVTVIQK